MIIGLTGGIATGKSTASRILSEQGIPVIDADLIAREVVMPEKDAYKKIIAFFGDEILLADKTLNRAKLGEIIFNDAEKRQKLNEIVHPAVRKEMKNQAERYLSRGNPLVVMDIPLLFESKLTHMVDKTWLIYTHPNIQLKRLMERDGYTEEQALSRITAQMPIDEKKELADVVIENNETIEELKQKLILQLQEVMNTDSKI
ncbi:dephospho-CoA kinase [Fictibacillus phosphorivorans]|uniref:dephospho-CoA kinase n=1 Tax=Fictibacillus phosphorivorans TaxID=1221500 RepID=UPI00203F641E|nr:dephospho-CoA kinase [Fictibacillus phosphorivorans]MCM3717904.1 dephospho-CoA kinase [Fictibacillus phosphorivorans]MCM3775353.1 dephospho-CoA kinase [Fictibacillus phosphorivorans]